MKYTLLKSKHSQNILKYHENILKRHAQKSENKINGSKLHRFYLTCHLSVYTERLWDVDALDGNVVLL